MFFWYTFQDYFVDAALRKKEVYFFTAVREHFLKIFLIAILNRALPNGIPILNVF